MGINGQKSTITLTFTAADKNTYIQLDSILVTNISQGMDTVLYYPDTVLVLEYAVGIPRNNKQDEGFRVIQNCPNPVTEQTLISIFVPEKDNVEISVSDIQGRLLLKSDWHLDRGYHSFSFTPGERGVLFLTTTWRGINSTIKILSVVAGKRGYALEYVGSKSKGFDLKSHETAPGFIFNPGDSLLYIGYAKTPAGINGSDVLGDRPQSDETYLFEIVEGIPCPGIPAINYGGQNYTTVQIGTQCWFKENLNIGTMMNSVQNQSNNGIIEKYCYDNLESNCNILGGLYQWNEMMQYDTTAGVQGICPQNWHLPIDPEWTTLTTFLGGLSIAGGKMKETGTIHWLSPNTGANNSSGFTALPGGYFSDWYNTFNYISSYAYFWSSTEVSSMSAWNLYLRNNSNSVIKNNTYTKALGFSVRCLKD